MHSTIQAAIEEKYRLKIFEQSPAPRQFVAETYVLTTSDGQRFFCKIIDKQIFIPKVIHSLPVLDELHTRGFNQLNYPIRTATGELHVMVDQTLIVLFNYLEALQSYDYNNFSLGQLIARLHQLSPSIQTPIQQMDFAFKYQTEFETQLQHILEVSDIDPLINQLSELTKKFEPQIRRYYATFQQLISTAKTVTFECVITHGDAPGNVLVKSPTELYLVDWDEILLAPAERDLWFLDDNQDFIAGYRNIFPHYQPNQLARQFSIYTRYFNDIFEYWAEILSDKPTEHRQQNLKQLKAFFTGWLIPHIQKYER